MKALSVRAPYAFGIVAGVKTVEMRTWQTDYRGELLICSSRTGERDKDLKGRFVFGKALAVVTLKDIVPYNKKKHARLSLIDGDYDGYAWILSDPRPVIPTPIKGKLHLFDVDYTPEYLDVSPDDWFDWLENNGYIDGYPFA